MRLRIAFILVSAIMTNLFASCVLVSLAVPGQSYPLPAENASRNLTIGTRMIGESFADDSIFFGQAQLNDSRPIISSFTTQGKIEISVTFPALEVQRYGDSITLNIPGGGSLLVEGSPIVPNFILRYVVPEDSEIVSCNPIYSEATILENLNLELCKSILQSANTSNNNQQTRLEIPVYNLTGSIVYRHISPQKIWCGNEIGTVVLYPLQYSAENKTGVFFHRSIFAIEYSTKNKLTCVLEKLSMKEEQRQNIDWSTHNLPVGARTTTTERIILLDNAAGVVKESIEAMSIWGRETKEAVYVIEDKASLSFYRENMIVPSSSGLVRMSTVQDLQNYVVSTWKSAPGVILSSDEPDLLGNAAAIASFMNYPMISDGAEAGLPILQELSTSFNFSYIFAVGALDESSLRSIAPEAKIISLNTFEDVVDWFAVERSACGYNTKIYRDEEQRYYESATVVNINDIKAVENRYIGSKESHFMLQASIDYAVVYDGSDGDDGTSYSTPAQRLSNYHSGIMTNGDGYSFWYTRDSIVKYYRNNYNTLYFALMGDGDDNVDSNGGAGNNGGQFDVPCRFLDYPWTSGPSPDDPGKIPTDFYYEELDLNPDPLSPLTSWSPDCYVGRVISDSPSNTQKYVDISWAYWIGEIDASSTYGGRFWRYNAHSFHKQKFEGYENQINTGIASVNCISQVYSHKGTDFNLASTQNAIDGTTTYTGSIVYFNTDGSRTAIDHNSGALWLGDIPNTVNHRYSLIVLDACLCGCVAGSTGDNSNNLAASLLKNSVGVFAFTVTAPIDFWSYSTNELAMCLTQLNSNYFGGSIAWGRKNYYDSSLKLDNDKRMTEALMFFGDPKNFLHPMKVDIKISSVSIAPSSSLTDNYLGSTITITASGTINNDKAWSNVKARFYIDGNDIGSEETGTWVESGTWSLSHQYTLPTSLTLGTHEIKVKALDADYWNDNFPSYTGGDIDLDGSDPNDWSYCDFTIIDNEKSQSLTISDDDTTPPSYSNPTTSPSGTVYDYFSNYIRLQIDWSDSSGISEVKFRCKYGSGSWTSWLSSSGSSGNTYWYDIPRSEWVNNVGTTIYWESYATDNDNDRSGDRLTTYTPTITGPSLADDDASGPSYSNPTTNPSGTVYDTYQGSIRLQVDWSDSSGISEVKFRCKYGSGSWTSWLSSSGSSGNTYWYDIPRSEWVNNVGTTIYWESYATDNDNDRSGDRLTSYLPTQTGPTIIVQAYAITFYTDPVNVGSVTFSGSTYTNGQTGQYAAGAYSVTANAPAGWFFNNWVTTGGVTVSGSTVTVSGAGTLKAVFFNLLLPLSISTLQPAANANITSSPILFQVNVTFAGIPVSGATVKFYADGSSPSGVATQIGSAITDATGSASISWTPTYTAQWQWYATAEKSGYAPATSATQILWYIPSVDDLYVLPAASKAPENVLRGQHHLILSVTPSQTILATAGAQVPITINYRLYAPINPNEIDQLFLIASWTPSWPPPLGYYYAIYDGIPGTSPISGSATFNISAPSSPGTYYLWYCSSAHYSIPLGVGTYASALTLPAHIKIVVTSPQYNIAFYTDPTDVGSITFSGTAYTNGQTGQYATGTYSVSANAPSSWAFSNWVTTGGVSISGSTATVTSAGTVKAVFTQATSPVAYLKFDEGAGNIAYDSSGNNNNGTVYTATWTDGRIGKALHFNGVDSWVRILNSPLLSGLSQITLEAWIKEDSLTSDVKGIISKCSGAAHPTYGAEYFLGLYGASLAFHVSNYNYIAHDTVVDGINQANRWYHVAATWSGSKYTLYIDGVACVSGTCTPQTTYSNALDVQIGRHGTYPWTYFQGIIDEVKIYNYARTADEIMNDYSEARLSASASIVPTIDGVLSPGEWGDADVRVFYMGPSSTNRATIYVKNDVHYLYIAFKIEGVTYGPSGPACDVFRIWFDNDNDGILHEEGDDILMMGTYSLIPVFEDLFYRSETGSFAWDTGFGGSTDGLGNWTHTNPAQNATGTYAFEISHPLNSNDDAHDFSLKMGDEVGFYVEFGEGIYLSNSTTKFVWGDEWPANRGAHIVIARSTPNLNFFLSPNPAVVGQTVTLVGNLTDETGQPINSTKVNVYLNGTLTASLFTNSSGWFTASGAVNSPGTYIVKVAYNGSDVYNPSNRTETLQVYLNMDTKVSFSLSPNPVTVGQFVTLKGNLTTIFNNPIGNAPLELWVKVGAGPWQYMAALSTNSTGWFQASGLVSSAGTYQVAVVYRGTSQYNLSYHIETLTVNP